MRPSVTLDVLILGASARAAAFSALRAGLRPIAVDLFADRDLAAACPCVAIAIADYPHRLAPLADTLPPCPWLYTGGLENHPDLVERIARRRVLWGNDETVLRRVRDPFAVFECLRREGLACPEVRRTDRGLPRDGRWLVKPLASSGGLGISRLGPVAATERPPCYYQEWIEGPSLSALFVAGRGEAALAGVTRQLVGRDGAEFAYAGSVGPWPMATAPTDQLRSIGEVLARSFGLAGLFGLDFILRDGHPWPVEVNPRYTASVEVLELALGRSLLTEHRRVFDAETPPPQEAIGARGSVGKRVVFAPGRGRLPAIEAPACPAEPFEVPQLADIPREDAPVRAGDPVLTVFASAASPEDCLAELERRSSEWRERLARSTRVDPE